MKDLIELYYISAPSGKENRMVNHIEKKLRSFGVTTYRDKANNLYATKGVSETYPCIVAHTDEVHAYKPKGFKVVQYQNMLFGIDANRSKFSGIGADDKNGIWVALKCFEKYDVMKAAFFVSEEIGCVGSRVADMNFFDDCRFVLQCDRKNGSDFITNASMTELCSDEFVKAAQIKRFGYKPAHGIMTDVMQLKHNGLSVSCANISCGYYNAHTENEYTVIPELENCLKLVENIIETCTDVYPHEDIFFSREKRDSEYLLMYDFYYEQLKSKIEQIVMQMPTDEVPDYVQLFIDLAVEFPEIDEVDISLAYEEVTGESLYTLLYGEIV